MTTRFIYGGFQPSRREENVIVVGNVVHFDPPNNGMEWTRDRADFGQDLIYYRC